MTQALVLTLDVGSSSVRAALFDTMASPVGTIAQRSYKLDVAHDGKATIDPQGLFDNVAEIIDETLNSLPNNCIIVGVALSTFWHSLIGVDKSNRPTTPVFTWADRRSSVHAMSLRNYPYKVELHRETGCPIHSSFWPARLLWLADTDPKPFSATRLWLSAADHLFLELFGEVSTSISMASGTGLFDLNQLHWSEHALRVAKIDLSFLPNVSDAPRRGLREKYRIRWPILANVPWFPAKGDGACSNIGANCMDDSKIAFMLGTSGSIRIVWEAGRAFINDRSQPPGVRLQLHGRPQSRHLRTGPSRRPRDRSTTTVPPTR